MHRYNQFILWVSQPSPTRVGRTEKYPVHPVTGRKHDAHDSSIWLSQQAAQEAAARIPGAAIGFTFTEGQGLFFLDVDDAMTPTGWSPLATQLCAQFAGCMVEVSQSGTGLHIIGSGTLPAGHPTRNTELHLECYSRRRFVALTGTGATGSSTHNAQAALDNLFTLPGWSSTTATVTPSDWSSTAAPEYTGPEDDTELIERMRRTTSVQGAFLGKATLSQLLDGETGCYGDDASAADSALCCHLAFWTGRNCERMDRLFRDSGLMREKWDRSAGGGRTYGQLTIAKACSLTRSVYSQPAPAAPDQPAPLDTSPQLRTGTQLITSTGLLDFFKGMTYVMAPNQILCPDGNLMDQSRFDNMHGGHEFMMDPQNTKPSKSAWEAFTKNRGATFPKVHDICFRPECEPGVTIQEEGRQLVNTYVPITTPSRQGDASRFIDHVTRMLPDPGDQAILLAYMAALVQHPGVKFQWAPLLVGMEGNGKSLLGTVIEHAVGSRYSHKPNAQDIDNKFNGWLQGKLFICLEEVYTADRANLIEVLKPLITNDRVEIQSKGQDQRTGDNRANFILFSNHKDAIRKTGTDRRYAVFFTAQQEPGDMERDGMTGGYFPDLYNWLRAEGYEIVNHWLREYQIPVELNPAVMAGGQSHRAPETSSTAEALANSLGGIEQEVMEAVAEGRPGFAGGWISSLALGRMLDEKRVAGKLPRNKRQEMLYKMGYITHPAMVGGRCAGVIPFDNGKPVLYVLRGSLLSQLRDQATVVKRYCDDQTGGGTQGASNPFAQVAAQGN